MPTKDKQGRPYAKLSELRAGQTVKVDGDFPCMEPWSTHTVQEDAEGLFIACKDGGHHLKGQADDGEHCIGIYA